MIPLALGLAALALLLWAARGFARARVANVKALLGWVAALAGLTAATGLLLTGRGAGAVGMMIVFGPMAWSWWQESKLTRRPGPGRAGPGRAGPGRTPPGRAGRMPRSEALDVLGLRDPVTEADVRAAYLRLIRVAHPDSGGSDWLAARVNQARDTLLGLA